MSVFVVVAAGKTNAGGGLKAGKNCMCKECLLFQAKPDYSFAYGVEDPLSGNYQNQREERDGDVVRGEYSVVDADGTMRRVTYTADPRNGFQATVHLSEPNAEHANQQRSYVRSLNQNSVGPSDYRQEGRYDDDY